MAEPVPQSRKAGHEALRLLDHPKGELDRMIAEHRQISEAVHEVARAAEAEGKPDDVGFAEELIVHARLEEEVLHPAAAVAGAYLRKLRGE